MSPNRPKNSINWSKNSIKCVRISRKCWIAAKDIFISQSIGSTSPKVFERYQKMFRKAKTIFEVVQQFDICRYTHTQQTGPKIVGPPQKWLIYRQYSQNGLKFTQIILKSFFFRTRQKLFSRPEKYFHVNSFLSIQTSIFFSKRICYCFSEGWFWHFLRIILEIPGKNALRTPLGLFVYFEIF